ncbi:hypothetical protein Peur_007184 [Populus x canadensis]
MGIALLYFFCSFWGPNIKKLFGGLLRRSLSLTCAEKSCAGLKQKGRAERESALPSAYKDVRISSISTLWYFGMHVHKSAHTPNAFSTIE